jgi:hypothetical protein
MERPEKHSNRPRVVHVVPMWWTLPKDMRDLVTKRMKARAEERDVAAKVKAEGDSE